MAKTFHDYISEAKQIVTEVTPAEAKEMISQPGVVVVDVREADEYAKGRLPNSVNATRSKLEMLVDETPELSDRSKKVICYCGGGSRGVLAAKTLKEMGFENVFSIAGGLRGWRESGLEEDASTSFDAGA